MKSRVLILVLLLTMIAAAGVWAQSLPGSIWTSPQSTTTEGRYRSNADNFIRPDAYSGVSFNKFFSMVSFLWDTDSQSREALATVGFATKVNGIYIGTFYNGNAWSGAPVNTYTEQEASPAGGTAGKVYNVYGNINVVGSPSPVNNAAVLIGVADMGFRLTYRTNYFSFNKDDIVTGNQLYSNYQAEYGYIAPQIAWAMAKNLTSSGIRPYVTVDLVFDRNYREMTAKGTDSSNNSGTYIERSANHFDPKFAAGLGGYTFYSNDGFSASADLDYELTLNIYDNEYTYEENGVYKTGKIKGTYNPGVNPLSERSYVSNLITPSLSGSWSKDRLALRFKLNLPLTFSSTDVSSMELDASNKLVNRPDYNSTSTSTFTFRPDIRLAMQYKLVPDKLTLNAGARLQASAITLETVNVTYYDSNSAKSGTAKRHQDAFGSGFVSRFSVGPTFIFTENFWVEATTGVTNTYGENAIEVFATGGLFSFGSILAVIKF